MKDIKENKTSRIECACNDRNHTIVAHHWVDIISDNNKEIYHEVDFDFVLLYGDWKANKDYYGDDNIVKETWLDFTNIFRRIWWRVKMSVKLLSTGNVRIEDDWMASQEGFDKLRKWMNQTDKLIKRAGGKIY
jgi:hypothetical protein